MVQFFMPHSVDYRIETEILQKILSVISVKAVCSYSRFGDSCLLFLTTFPEQIHVTLSSGSVFF